MLDRSGPPLHAATGAHTCVQDWHAILITQGRLHFYLIYAGDISV